VWGGIGVSKKSKKTWRRVGNTLLIAVVSITLWNILSIGSAVASNFTANHTIYGSAATVFEAVVVAVSAIVAYRAYRAAMDTAAKQTTIERVFQEHNDREVVRNRSIFRSLKTYTGGTTNGAESVNMLLHFVHSSSRNAFIDSKIVESGADPKSFDRKKNASQISEWQTEFNDNQSAIFAVLNRYETFAIGIAEGAIDEALYKRWWRSSLIGDWYAAREAIEKVRETAPKVFVEFEQLARRWENEKLEESTEGGQG